MSIVIPYYLRKLFREQAHAYGRADRKRRAGEPFATGYEIYQSRNSQWLKEHEEYFGHLPTAEELAVYENRRWQ